MYHQVARIIASWLVRPARALLRSAQGRPAGERLCVAEGSPGEMAESGSWRDRLREYLRGLSFTGNRAWAAERVGVHANIRH